MIKKADVYAAKTADPNEFAKMGWDLLPMQITGGDIVVYKWVRLRRNSKAVKALIDAYNANADMIVGVNSQYLYELGLHFVEKEDERTGVRFKELALTDEAYETLCLWRLEIDMDSPERYMRLHPNDFTFPNPFYPANIIEKYASKAIEGEIGKGLIERITVEYEAPENAERIADA